MSCGGAPRKRSRWHMTRLPDGSYVTTLQEKSRIAGNGGNGKAYLQFGTYFPVKEMLRRGWRAGLTPLELRLRYVKFKDKDGPHEGWMIELYSRKCSGCGAYNSHEAAFCIECGAPQTRETTPPAGSAV